MWCGEELEWYGGVGISWWDTGRVGNGCGGSGLRATANGECNGYVTVNIGERLGRPHRRSQRNLAATLTSVAHSGFCTHSAISYYCSASAPPRLPNAARHSSDVIISRVVPLTSQGRLSYPWLAFFRICHHTAHVTNSPPPQSIPALGS